jgi:bis(5'-adenosyl)-triphosphatase
MPGEKPGKRGSDVFCSGIINNGVFYKTKHTMAVCDIAPVVYGHSLIIPVRHVLDVDDLSEEEILDLFNTVKKVNQVLLRLYGDESKSYDMTTQVGEYSGMSVRHLHFHLIPRRKADSFQHGKSVFDAIERVARLPEEEYAKRVAVLRKELKWSE